jgi:hypothetical protein
MRKFGLGLATATAVIATPAAARDGAWYVGGDFGAMIVEDTDVDIGGRGRRGHAQSRVRLRQALFVGYDLGRFRLEAEVSYKKADLDSFYNAVRLPCRRRRASPSARMRLPDRPRR